MNMISNMTLPATKEESAILRFLSSIEGDISFRRDRVDIVGLIENLD